MSPLAEYAMCVRICDKLGVTEARVRLCVFLFVCLSVFLDKKYDTHEDIQTQKKCDT